MEELLKAIKTQWDAAAGASIRAKATGGLWPVEAKQEVTTQATVKPYVVYHPLPGTVFNTNTGTIEEAFVQFSIFCTSESAASTCVQIRDLLVALYDDVQLSMTGFNMVRAIRQSSGHLVKDPDEGYALHVDYMFMYG